MWAKRKGSVVFPLITSIIPLSVLWVHLQLLFQGSHRGSPNLVRSEVCSVTRSRLFAFSASRKINIIPALPIAFLSPADRALWSPTRTKVIHFPSVLTVLKGLNELFKHCWTFKISRAHHLEQWNLGCQLERLRKNCKAPAGHVTEAEDCHLLEETRSDLRLLPHG